jgi:hypothetical protein
MISVVILGALNARQDQTVGSFSGGSTMLREDAFVEPRSLEQSINIRDRRTL